MVTTKVVTKVLMAVGMRSEMTPCRRPALRWFLVRVQQRRRAGGRRSDVAPSVRAFRHC